MRYSIQSLEYMQVLKCLDLGMLYKQDRHFCMHEWLKEILLLEENGTPVYVISFANRMLNRDTSCRFQAALTSPLEQQLNLLSFSVKSC